MREPHDPPATWRFAPVLTPEPTVRLDGRRVMIADGCPAVRLLLCDALQACGATVHFASDPSVGVFDTHVALDEGEPYDVVLLGVEAGGASGLAAARGLRESGFAGVLIALADASNPGLDARCLAAGCDAVLHRPVDPRRLLTAIEAALEPGDAAEDAPCEADRPEPEGVHALRLVGDGAGETEAASAGPPRFPVGPVGSVESVEGFVQQLPAMVDAVLDAARAKDLAELETLVHEVKRSAGRHGFGPISQAAGRLERRLRDDPEELDPLASEIEDLTAWCDRVVSAAGPPTDPDQPPLPPSA